jgi:endonuclease/exonuclease/phosphatase family metal-dependent hydrolase
MTLWDSSQLDLEVNFHSNHWLLIVFRSRENGHKISIINLYMPNRYMDKVECWRSLLSFKDNLDLPSCIVVGDFNTILQNSEKRGGNSVRDPMWEMMEDLISGWDLYDVKPPRESTPGATSIHILATLPCLDRFLIHNNFLLLPLSISSNIIPSTISDHKPISLTLSSPQNFGPIPFLIQPLMAAKFLGHFYH